MVTITLNSIVSQVFMWVTNFQKLRYKTEEQLSGFKQIVFMEFFNMGLIMLIISFDPSNTINKLKGLEDQKIYNGFEQAWYEEVG